MNSFISSFRRELKVVLFLVALLIGCDAAVRLLETRLSFDLVHIREIPAIVQKNSEGDQPRIIFLGNSLTREGIDENSFKKGFAGRVTVARVYPDDTTMLDWYYVFQHLVAVEKGSADVLVLGFSRRQLDDQNVVHPRRLGRYFTGWSEMPEVVSRDLEDFEQISEYSISRISSSFANAERVAPRVFDKLIPYYRESAQRLNRRPVAGSKPEPPPTYQRLRRFSALADQRGIKVVLLAIPVGENYAIDPRLRQVVKDLDLHLIDGNELEGLEPTSFPDGLHMDDAAAKVFSEFVAAKLAGNRDLFEESKEPR